MLKTEGIDFAGEKYFMTKDYLKMMWRRIELLRHVLEMGYSFVFTVIPVMWSSFLFLSILVWDARQVYGDCIVESYDLKTS